MTITLNGTTGITTPDVTSSGSLNIDASAPDNSLVVDASGNVGVGVTPTNPFHVYHPTTNTVALLESGDPGCYLAFKDDTTTSSTAVLLGAVGNVLQFNAAGAERMRIDSSGALLVGVSSATIGSGNAHHLITANNELNLAASITSDRIYLNYRAGTTLTALRFMNGNSAGGYVACYGTSFTNSSDYRIKTDVQEVGSVLPKVAQLRPVNYIKQGVEGREFGLIAHEAQAVFPDMVSGEKDAVDEDGDMEIQGIDYAQLSTILVKAIQEQQAIIDEQKTALEALTARVSALEAA